MSDKVTGIAVLNRKQNVLHICTPSKSVDRSYSTLPVYEKGTPKPLTIAWEYEIKGDQIHVTPSVRIITTRPSKTNPEVNEEVELFHNEGSWSVRFREFVPTVEHSNAYDLFKVLNGLVT